MMLPYFRIRQLFLSIAIPVISFSIISCSNGTSNPSTTPPQELGVAAFTPNTSVSESPLWVSTAPSTGTWTQYISGTTASIMAVAANNSNILAFDGTNFIISNANGGQFNKFAFTGGALSSATIVAGDQHFVMYSGNNIWSISNTGSVTPSALPGLNSNISAILYLDNQFYAYTSGNTVYSSLDGISWHLVNTSQNIQPFTNVIKLNNGLYAAMTAPQLGTSNGNMWLGTSPTEFNNPANFLQNFFGAPAQVNFIGTNGDGNLYINETVSFTQQTIREYFIENATQVSTNAVVQVISLPSSLTGTQKPTGIYFATNNIFITCGTIATTNNPTGNLIDPTGPTTLTAVNYVTNPNITSQIVGDQEQTNGSITTVHKNNLIVAPGNSSNNNGLLTLVTNASNAAIPNFAVLPSGTNATYTALIGNPNNYMLLLGNGGALLNSGNSGYMPVNAITNTANPSGSTPVTSITSSGSINGSFLVQATSNGGGINGDLYFSQNGTSWAMIPQSSLSANNLGALQTQAVSVNKINNIYNIITSNGTYQTQTPTILKSWIIAPSPTPLFQINNVLYTLYPNSNNVGTLANLQYIVTQTLPQNYVSSGNVAYNGTGTIALAQAATIVEAADKIAGTNYLWTAASFTGPWTLNLVTFINANGQPITTEFFNANPVLIWTGKVWITQGNGQVLLNVNNLPTNIYSSNDAISWQSISSSGQSITGTPAAF